LLRPIANLALPDEPTSVTVRAGTGAGLRLIILPRTEKYYWSGLYEPRAQEVIAEHLAPGSVMWDVGAHIGFLSAIAARAVGPTGHVVAFEPLPENASRLRQTVEANALANITIREVAVSSSVGISAFYVHSSSLVGGLTQADGAQPIEVPTTTLDAELGVSPPPALVKVDVEGHEAEVIVGGHRVFNEVRPFLIIELLTDEAIARAQTLLPHYAFSRIDEMNFVGEPTL
jgi:FkbM family methyltransferase